MVFFMYGLMKDHSDGEYYRENTFVQPSSEMTPIISLTTDEEREAFSHRVTNNLSEGFNIPGLAQRIGARGQQPQQLLEEEKLSFR